MTANQTLAFVILGLVSVSMAYCYWEARRAPLRDDWAELTATVEGFRADLDASAAVESRRLGGDVVAEAEAILRGAAS